MATANDERARFTAWLSTVERQAIRDRARELHASDNYIVRMAIRQYLGLSIDADTTVVTRNKRDLSGELHD